MAWITLRAFVDHFACAASMAIRKIVTPSGKYVSYETSRSEEISHGDVAWAVMMALIHEPMSGYEEGSQGMMEIY
ncbi:hypothetical protein HBY09_000520 [Salmonella enterica]|nr:hypothetical protein [Salmonella enterica]